MHFKNAADGQQVELDLKGDWFDRSAKITLNGAVVAEVARKFFNVREMFGDKQTVSLVFLLFWFGFSMRLADDIIDSTLLRLRQTSTSRSSQPFASAWTSARTRSKRLSTI